MNILLVTNHLNVGGITSYCLTLATGLKKRGHNVYLASSGGELADKFREEGIIFVPIPIRTKSEISPKIIFSLIKLIPFIRKEKISVIHANSRTTQVLSLYLSRLCRIPYVSTCHGFFQKRAGRLIFPCWGEMTVAISDSVKEHLVNDFRLNPQRVRVIYNGIDTERFKKRNSVAPERLRKELNLKEGPVIGIIARLSDVKGHIYLLEAMKEVIEGERRAQLIIAGEGKMKLQLLALCRTLGIENNVYFMPSAKDTIDVLSLLDVFVMPSLKEGLGLALMEAMAFGLAVVGSRVGGIENLISHAENGLLVPAADPKALGRAILELLLDKEKRLRFGSAASLFISKNFSAEKMSQQTERLYLECQNA